MLSQEWERPRGRSHHLTICFLELPDNVQEHATIIEGQISQVV